MKVCATASCLALASVDILPVWHLAVGKLSGHLSSDVALILPRVFRGIRNWVRLCRLGRLQQVGSFLGYTGRAANTLGKAAPDPAGDIRSGVGLQAPALQFLNQPSPTLASLREPGECGRGHRHRWLSVRDYLMPRRGGNDPAATRAPMAILRDAAFGCSSISVRRNVEERLIHLAPCPFDRLGGIPKLAG
jgi:hypothetical protein